MIEIKLFQPTHKQQWDKFILSAKNGHFMFCRDYMDYHSDRFNDHSLMFTNEGQLVALLPANIADNVLYSHQGLTFGGIISDSNMTTLLMVSIIDKLIEYLKHSQIKKLIYKHIPYIYSTLPTLEDFYVLYNKEAKLYRVDVSSTINLDDRIEFSSRRKRGVKKALKANLSVTRSNNYAEFYLILEKTLNTKHNVMPTHSLAEIEVLASRFPENISLYVTIDQDGKLLAAVLVYEMNHWVHTQYIVSSERGKEVGALDLLFNVLINNIYTHKKFFDFGISTEAQGKILNHGLITQKEEFGGRAVVHNFLELNMELS